MMYVISNDTIIKLSRLSDLVKLKVTFAV